MPKDTETIEKEGKRTIPQPVRLALDILSGLEEGRAEKLRRALPAFAMTRARQGTEVTEAFLREALARGDDAIIGPRVPFQRASRTISQRYASIVAAMSGPENAPDKDDTAMSPDHRLIKAAARGDLAVVDAMIAQGADVHAGRDASLFNAACHGHLDVVRHLVGKRADIHAMEDAALLGAAMNGHLAVTMYLVDEGANIQARHGEALRRSVEYGHRDVMAYLAQKAGKKYEDMGDALELASVFGRLEVVKHLVENGTKVQDKAGSKAFRQAVFHGHRDVVIYLANQGADIRGDDNSPLNAAVSMGYGDIAQFLIGRGADVGARDNFFLHLAHETNQMNLVKVLVDNGADIGVLAEANQQKVKSVLQNMDRWMQETDAYPPIGLESMAVGSFKAADVRAVGELIANEGYSEKTANRYACHAVRLFGSAEKVMDYLERWGKKGKQPLHDAVQMIKTPDRAVDVPAWAEAVMACGPGMARLFKFADKLARPLKSVNGKAWSTSRTRDETAKFVYPRAGENMKLAALFNRYAKDEGSFDKALDLIKTGKEKTRSRIPDITINGERFGMPGAAFRKLPDGDYRGLVLGEITDCCQSIGSAGSRCAEHGFTSENGGFYIIATNDNEIIAQSWAWRGGHGELVLDSLETLGTRVTPPQWASLAAAFARALEKTDVTALHIGAGGKTPKDFPFDPAGFPAHPVDYYSSRDSSVQYCVWKR